MVLLLMPLLAACAADTMPIDLRALERGGAPNEALACPPGLCGAEVDIESPTFAAEPAELRELVRRTFAAQPRSELAAEDEGLPQLVFVQRSALFGFPDTVRAQVVALDGGSSLLLHSRSNVGYWDLGVNRARLRDWLAALVSASGG